MILGILASAIRAAISGGDLNYDPYWDKVSLMLHGDATGIVDSSKNARAPSETSSGVQQRTDIKKFGTGSIQGSGSPPLLNYAASPDFDLAGVYTLEFWLYLDQYPTGQAFWMGNSAVNYLTMDTGGNFGGSGNSIRWPTAMPLNTWVHLAACRDSTNTTRSFINGKLVASETSSLTTAGSVPLGLFSIPGRSDLRGLQGTIDEFRFTAGVARYSGDFPLQTAPFPGAKPVDPVTPVADPLYSKIFALLHADSSTIVDSGPAKRTSPGTLPMAPKSKFGSGAFDLSANTSNGVTIDGGGTLGMQGDVTTEFWLYVPAATSGNLLYFKQTAGDSVGVNYYIRGNGYLAVYNQNQGPFVSTDLGSYIGQWVHVAITRTIMDSLDTHTIFLNGKKAASTGIPISSNGALDKLYIGAASVSQVGPSAAAYIDEIRVTQAVRYTADFTPPTAPFADSAPATAAASDPFWNKTTVLAHLDSSIANKGNSSRVLNSSSGLPTFNTNVKKFGSAAVQPLSSEQLSIDGLNLSSAFTMEAWVCFPTAPSSVVYPFSFASNSYIWATVGGGGAGVQFGFQVFGSALGVSDPIKLGQFYHMALCRDADNNVTLYWDGKPQGTVRPNVYSGTGTFSFTGNAGTIGPQTNDMLIDEFRFTEACRYAGTFTPPTAAYGEFGNPKVNLTDPYWANVKSLLPLDGDFLDAADAPPLWSKVGAPVISTEQTLFGLPTLKLDGASALVSGQTGPITGILTSNEFTVEAWVYPTRRSTAGNDYQRFISLEADGQPIMQLQRLNGAQLQIVFDASSQSGFMNLSQEPTFNAWNHIALTRKENSYRFFLNGKLLATSASSGALPNVAWVLGAGVIGSVQKEFFTGFMGQFRITSGVARYLNDFAVPTTAFPKAVTLPADPYWKNVAFLSHFDGAQAAGTAVDERGATMQFGAGATLLTGTKKFGTAALNLNGQSSGYVDIPSSNRYDLGALDFTIEMQVFWAGNVGGLIGRRDGVAMGWAIQVESDGRLALRATVGTTWNDSQITTAAGALKSAVWTHVALTRKGTTFSLWLDGKLAATKAIAGAVEDSTYPIRLGQSTSINYNENPFGGSLDEVRITPGVSRYNAEFVPPAAPFAAYGPAATATKVTTGRKFNGSEYLQGDAQGLLRTTRTFFVDFTPDSAASADKLAIVASTDYDDYGWPYVIGSSSRSALDQFYGKMGWYRRTAKENGQAVIGWANTGDLIGIRQRLAFVFDADQPLPGSFSEGARPGREVVNGTVRTASAAMQIMSLASRIGLGKGDGHEPFKGTIRAVAFWDRSLTESEVNRLMTSETYDLADFPGLSNAWLPENIADGKLANSAAGGSPMALVSTVQAKTYALRGSTGLTQVVTSYADDAYARLPTVGFPVMVAGTDYQATIYAVSNSYLTFGGETSTYVDLGPSNPARTKLFVAAADRSYFQVWAGIVDSGNAYTVRWVGNAGTGNVGSDPSAATHLWEVTFYKDGSIVLVTGAISNNEPSGLASTNAWLAQLTGLSPNSAYLFTPQDAQGNTWTVEKKA